MIQVKFIHQLYHFVPHIHGISMSLRWSFVAGSAVTNSVYWKCRLRKVQWGLWISQKIPNFLVRKILFKREIFGRFFGRVICSTNCALFRSKLSEVGEKIATNSGDLPGNCQVAFWRRRNCDVFWELQAWVSAVVFSTGKKASDSVQDVAMASFGSGFCRFVWWDVQGRTVLSPWEEKLFTPQKTPLLFGKKAQQLEDLHEKSTAFLAGCEFNPRKFTEEKVFAHFLLLCLTKIPSEKKSLQGSPTKISQKWSFQISHQKSNTSTPPLDQKTGRPCNSWTYQAIWSPTSSWWIRFLGETPICSSKENPTGILEEEVVGFGVVWLVGWSGWLVGWSGLVEVVWLWWSCNLGDSSDPRRMDKEWKCMTGHGVKRLHGLILLALPRKLKRRNSGTSFLCPPISI